MTSGRRCNSGRRDSATTVTPGPDSRRLFVGRSCSVVSYLQSMIPHRSPHNGGSPVEVDPVIEAYKRDIDRTLLRENLRKSVEEQLAALVALQRLAEEARRAGRRASRCN